MASQHFPSKTIDTSHISDLTKFSYTVMHAPRPGPQWTCQLMKSFVHGHDKQLTSTLVQDLPDHYTENLKMFTWRRNVISILIHYQRETGLSKLDDLLLTLQRYLVYMECIIDILVKEAGVVDDRVPHWRCRTFDLYLITEFCVRRHEPEAVRQYRRTSNVNLNRVDINTLGECLPLL